MASKLMILIFNSSNNGNCAEHVARLSGPDSGLAKFLVATRLVGRASRLAQVVVEVAPFASALWAALTAAE
eukprot:5538410-Amphidinium_carterae.1